MSTMIERVARPIFNERYLFRGISDFDANMHWHLAYGQREAAIKLAKAALEELRQPTEAMKVAGEIAAMHNGDAAAIFRAMIDAVLEEKAD